MEDCLFIGPFCYSKILLTKLLSLSHIRLFCQRIRDLHGLICGLYHR